MRKGMNREIRDRDDQNLRGGNVSAATSVLLMVFGLCITPLWIVNMCPAAFAAYSNYRIHGEKM